MSKKKLSTSEWPFPELSAVEIKKMLTILASKKILQKMFRPHYLNLGLGIGAYFLIKYALRYFREHPEIKETLQEHLISISKNLKIQWSIQQNNKEPL